MATWVFEPGHTVITTTRLDIERYICGVLFGLV
jgi:hypothetical protein